MPSDKKQPTAIIVGGSNGIGLALAAELKRLCWSIEVLDIVEPDAAIGECKYTYCDLLDYDEQLFCNIKNRPDVHCLIITAGFGRVCRIDDLHQAEVDRMLRVNAVSAIRILTQLFQRLNAKDDFYCCVMGSIAGRVCSPLFAAYGASKAALRSFIESANGELASEKARNRILEVSPGSLKGTRFYGDESTDIEGLSSLAKEVINRMFKRERLYIPSWDTVYKNVVERYRANPEKFAAESYAYKLKSGRMDTKKRVKIGYLSGTFDLFHIGHLNLLKRAKGYCDYLVVGVHPSGKWKGKDTFIPFDERKAIVGACKYVDRVIDAPDEDSDAWESIGYSLLFVGSDYEGSKRFLNYSKILEPLGVKIVFFPYTSGVCSSQLRKTLRDSIEIE